MGSSSSKQEKGLKASKIQNQIKFDHNYGTLTVVFVGGDERKQMQIKKVGPNTTLQEVCNEILKFLEVGSAKLSFVDEYDRAI
ncbi:MAG: hypothetical protein EZS28_027385 [Streblomastix strix]|uniref:Uncharacterized protein n=1 Tax=Streblomastix strix TaxID=222440 RepID=A0A5J4V3Z4_9EUKA|nr:MAG: hypothetical protein EZS28_027385 [Streblomastix strix]